MLSSASRYARRAGRLCSATSALNGESLSGTTPIRRLRRRLSTTPHCEHFAALSSFSV
jgi:hypothetical protein